MYDCLQVSTNSTTITVNNTITTILIVSLPIVIMIVLHVYIILNRSLYHMLILAPTLSPITTQSPLPPADSKVIDGVNEIAAADSLSSDNSFYFVLGSAGSSAAASGRSTGLAANNGNAEGRCKGRALPPGWDRYSMAGMCVGERRRIVVPPSLAFGAVGLLAGSGSGSSSGSGREAIVPPNTPLVIEVRLLSLNGIE